MKNIYIITGGTMIHVTPHFSLCAPAYGKVGTQIYKRLTNALDKKEKKEHYGVFLIKTKMAGGNPGKTNKHLQSLNLDSSIETNSDLERFVEAVISKPETAGIIMAAAICDFEPDSLTCFEETEPVSISKFGKDTRRLHKAHSLYLKLHPCKKIIDMVKTKRPDIVLITFKTTAGLTEEDLIKRSGLNLQRSKSDLVFGNDIHSRKNIVVTPDDTALSGKDRLETLDILCDQLLKKIGPV